MELTYLIHLSDGSEIQIIPTNVEQTILTVDYLSISLKNDTYSISSSIGKDVNDVFVKTISKAQFNKPEGVEILTEGVKKHQTPEGILRNCIICNGRQYCITGGCANTPCGWICDNPHSA